MALGREAGIDTTTGKGVADAVAAADVIVNLTNSPSWVDDDMLAFFRDSTTHLLAAEQAAEAGLIASRDVVSRLVEVSTGSPLGATVEIAGPEPLSIDELVRRLFAATGDERTDHPGRVAAGARLTADRIRSAS